MQITPEQEEFVRNLDINDITKQYIALRDAKEAIAKKVKGDLEKLNKGMQKLEIVMLMWLKTFKVESTPHPATRPTLTNKTGATVGDREAFMRFAGEDFANRSGFLTNAISKDSVKQHMESHEGVPPPGVNWYSEAAVGTGVQDEA